MQRRTIDARDGAPGPRELGPTKCTKDTKERERSIDSCGAGGRRGAAMRLRAAPLQRGGPGLGVRVSLRHEVASGSQRQGTARTPSKQIAPIFRE